jgi:hypothetical protein
VRVNIEDGWTSGFGGCPLRLSAARRSTSPSLRLEEEEHRGLSASGEAGRGGALCSSEPKRISIALAHEFLGAGLGEAFDVFEIVREIADAGEEVAYRRCACGPMDGSLAGPERHLRDLTGAAADHELKRALIIVDDLFEVAPRICIVLEMAQALLAEHLLDEVAHLFAQRLGALAHRVGRESCAQDDPEQLHGSQYKRAGSPAESARLYPTIS